MSVNTVKKRSISKPDKHYTSSEKHLNTLGSAEKKHSKKRTMSIAQEKQTSKQLHFRQSAFNLKLDFDKLMGIAETLSSTLFKLKAAVTLKSVEARQSYTQLKNVKALLLEQMKSFQITFLDLLDFSTHHLNLKLESPKKQEYMLDQTKEKNLKNSKHKNSTADSQSALIEHLKIQLSELQAITHTAISRENSLQNQLSFQQVQISKYKQLLKHTFQSEPLQLYFSLIHNYKEYKLVLEEDGEYESIDLETKIQNQEQYLHQSVKQREEERLLKLEENKRKTEQLKELTNFIESIKDNLNSTNIQYTKVKQSLLKNQSETSELLRILDISQGSNFFQNFGSICNKIKEIHFIISGNKTTLPERINDLVSSLSLKSKRVQECEHRIAQQQRQLQEATEQYENVTASYIKINNKHIDLVKSYKLVSSRAQMLQNHNNQLTKLIKRLDQISEDESQGEEDNIQLNIEVSDQQTIVKQLRRSEQEMRVRINTLKQQYKVSEGVISQYQKQISSKSLRIQNLQNSLELVQQKLKHTTQELNNKKQQMQFHKSQASYLQSRLAAFQSVPLPPSQKFQFLQHISKQQSELNKLSFTFNANKETISSLEHHIFILQNQVEEYKSKLLLEKEAVMRLFKQDYNLKLVISDQQFEITTLTQKCYQKGVELETLEAMFEQIKQQLRNTRNDLRLQQAETGRSKSITMTAQFEHLKLVKECERLERDLQEKECIIRQNYMMINTLKSKTDQEPEEIEVSKRTLFQDLNDMVNDEEVPHVFDRLKFPVPELLEIKSESEGLPMAYSQDISIEAAYDYIPEHKTYSRVLKQLSSDDLTSDKKFDHFLQNFNSNKRIQQIQNFVKTQLEPPRATNNILFSNRRISEIDIEKPFSKNTKSTQQLLNLL